ncbi:MAG TPA: hypothetical protein VH475_21810 [Tepidisphaeraceae bacterium]
MRDSLDDLEFDVESPADARGRAAVGADPGTTELPPAGAPSPAQQVRRALRGKHVCPFCGTGRETEQGPCVHCNLEDTPTTRSATRSKLGPWYVLQSRNPAAPGMNFATLMVLVQKGRVTARSIVRGPTTGQFWRHAAKVKGLSREFGLCWNCGGDVARNARACTACKRLQEPPINPDILLESSEYSGDELAEAIWSDDVSGGRSPSPVSMSSPAASSASRASGDRQTAASPVERLVARGGVRREVTPVNQMQQEIGYGGGMATATTAVTTRGGARLGLGESAGEDHHAAGLEMAVFNAHRHRGGGAGRALRSVTGKLFKVLFIAVLLTAAVVVAWASFDPGFRTKLTDVTQKSWAWASARIESWKSSASSAPSPSAATNGSDRAPDDSVSRPVVSAQPTMVFGRPTSTRVGAGAASTSRENAKTTAPVVPAAVPAAAAPAAPSPEQAKLKVWELWKVGVEAEKKSDFAAAVKAWEQIKTLGVAEDDLPLGLDARIVAAKRRVK